MKNAATLLVLTATLFGSSIASAETLFIPAAEGVRDQPNSLCFDPVIPTGEMQIVGGANCMVSYPLHLPTGKTIDAVEIAYRYQNIGTPSITAYVAQNRLKPNLGAIAVAGASAQPKVGAGQELYLSIPAISVPVVSGSTYWVQIFDTDVQTISYVEVSYH